MTLEALNEDDMVPALQKPWANTKTNGDAVGQGEGWTEGDAALPWPPGGPSPTTCLLCLPLTTHVYVFTCAFPQSPSHTYTRQSVCTPASAPPWGQQHWARPTHSLPAPAALKRFCIPGQVHEPFLRLLFLSA